MTDLVIKLAGFIVRIGLMLAGLVFFISLLVVALVLLLFWLLRALWAKVTGQAVQPWTFQVNRQAVWQRFYRDAPAQQSQPERAANDDVIDVEPKRIESRD